MEADLGWIAVNVLISAAGSAGWDGLRTASAAIAGRLRREKNGSHLIEQLASNPDDSDVQQQVAHVAERVAGTDDTFAALLSTIDDVARALRDRPSQTVQLLVNISEKATVSQVINVSRIEGDFYA